MKTDQPEPSICSSCHHPESDHKHGHCNGISNRTEPLPGNLDQAAVMSGKRLCGCQQFIPKRQHVI